MLTRFSILSVSLILLLFGCAKSDVTETDGKVIRLSNGHVKAVAPSEEESVCASSRCEDNFIYYASFGRKRSARRVISSTPGNEPPPPPSPEPAPVQPEPSRPLPNPAQEYFEYSLARMGVRDAWAITQGRPEIVVAVIDTGVDYNHPDLRNNIKINQAEQNGQSGVDDDGNGYIDDVAGWDFANNRANGYDDNNHGTHVAGIIAAEANGFGAVGVAPKVKILPVKFLSASGSGTTEAAVNAIRYAIENGAHIISNSWGGSGRSQFLDDVIQEAQNRGILVVAAAGNEANSNDSRATYPSNYSGVISVASSDESDNLSNFSNYGSSTVTIAAPGSNIYSTTRAQSYNIFSGTSMAAPQVSGALALALSLGNLSASAVKAAMCQTAANILRDRTSCGRLDVYNLVRNAE